MPDPNGQAQVAENESAQVAAASQEGGEQESAVQTYDADYVRKLRSESAANRRRAADLEARLKQIEDSQLSESERLQKQLQELQAEKANWQRERRDLSVRQALQAAFAAEGARKPDALVRLFADQVDADDNGQIKNQAALLKQARADYPELFVARNGSADAAAGARSGGSGLSMNDLIRRAAGRTA